MSESKNGQRVKTFLNLRNSVTEQLQQIIDAEQAAGPDPRVAELQKMIEARK